MVDMSMIAKTPNVDDMEKDANENKIIEFD